MLTRVGFLILRLVYPATLGKLFFLALAGLMWLIFSSSFIDSRPEQLRVTSGKALVETYSLYSGQHGQEKMTSSMLFINSTDGPHQYSCPPRRIDCVALMDKTVTVTWAPQRFPSWHEASAIRVVVGIVVDGKVLLKKEDGLAYFEEQESSGLHIVEGLLIPYFVLVFVFSASNAIRERKLKKSDGVLA